jgi:hypothetical protein
MRKGKGLDNPRVNYIFIEKTETCLDAINVSLIEINLNFIIGLLKLIIYELLV